MGVIFSNMPEFKVKGRADLSQFLVHLTRTGSFVRFYDNNGMTFYTQGETVAAKDSLTTILKDGMIRARSPVGYFRYGHMRLGTKGRIPWDWLRCTCFSETPLYELSGFYRSSFQTGKGYEKYGLAFMQEKVRAKHGNPIFYVDSRNKNRVDSLNKIVAIEDLESIKSLLPLFQHFGPRTQGTDEIDYRWEREWRHVGDFAFEKNEVAFGLCPEKEIDDFEQLAGKQVIFVDPDWDPLLLKKKLKEKNRFDLLSAL